MGKNTAQFDAALKTITEIRGAVYGPAETTFIEIADLQAALPHCNNPAVRHAMEMMCVKMVRLCRTPDHLDSVIDIAGYARTIAMILDARAEVDRVLAG